MACGVRVDFSPAELKLASPRPGMMCSQRGTDGGGSARPKESDCGADHDSEGPRLGKKVCVKTGPWFPSLTEGRCQAALVPLIGNLSVPPASLSDPLL